MTGGAIIATSQLPSSSDRMTYLWKERAETRLFVIALTILGVDNKVAGLTCRSPILGPRLFDKAAEARDRVLLVFDPFDLQLR